MNDVKLILIGGTSHVGKSTVGRRLADDFGWNYLSTDQLARHPGRPWSSNDRPIPEDVVEHYTSLSIAELVDSVLRHYQDNVWPIVDAMVQARLRNRFDVGLVFEGSAILPELVAASKHAGVNTTWLTAPEDLIKARIVQSSDYRNRSEDGQRLVDAFHQRTIAIDRLIRDSTEANRQVCLDVSLVDVYGTIKSRARSVTIDSLPRNNV